MGTKIVNKKFDSQTTFKQWLVTQAKKDTLIGDLARDSMDDKKFPTGIESYGVFETHLFKMFACREALLTLPKAWRKYKKAIGEPL